MGLRLGCAVQPARAWAWIPLCFLSVLCWPREGCALGPRRWAVEDQSIVYCLGGSTILRVDVENRSLTTIASPPGMEGHELLEIAVADGFLWVATDSMVANADLRYLDWVVFDADTGVPLPGYAGMAFEEGVGWLSGRREVGRFDQYTEQWTRYPMPADTLMDLELFGGEVWLAAGESLIRFNPTYETIRVYRCGIDLPIHRVTWLLRVRDELWAVAHGELARYLPSTESWQDLACPALHPVQAVIQGSLVWLLGQENTVVYDLESSTCRAPPWMDRVSGVALDGALHQGRVYLSTDAMLAVYQASGSPAELKGDLAFPGDVDGLTQTPLRRIASTGTRLVGLGSGFLAAFLDEEEEWWVAGVADGAGRGASRPRIRIGDGLEVATGALPPLRFSGSSTFQVQGSAQNGRWDSSDRYRVRMTARCGRVSGFVDNTDLSLGDRYGAQYRGPSEATLRELGGGWRRADTELMELAGRPGFRGGWVWIERGARSPVRKRRAIQGLAWAGERTTLHAEEFFPGGSSSYRLAHGNAVIGSVRLYLDDELLDEGSFTLDHSSGSFFLSSAERDLVSEDSVIRVAYDYWLDDDSSRGFLASPQVVLNRGDRWTLSLGSLIEGEEGDTRAHLSGGVRYRTDPGASQRFHVETELLTDLERSRTGSRSVLSFAAPRIEVGLTGISLPRELETEARAQTEYGPLDREVASSGRVEPWRSLPFSWQIAWRGVGDLAGSEGSGRLTWTRPRLPALGFEAAARTWSGDSLDARWRKFELGADYDPRSLPGFEKMRIQMLVRESRDDTEHSTVRYRSGLARMQVRPAGTLDLSLLAWGRRADDVTGDVPVRVSGRGHGLVTATSTPMRGVSLYLRGEGDVATSDYQPSTKDAALSRSILASAVVRPGSAPIELEGTLSRSLTDVLDDIDRRQGVGGILSDVGDSVDVRHERNALVGGGPVIFLPRHSTLRLRATTTTRTSGDSSGAYSRVSQNGYRVSLDLWPLDRSRWLVEGNGTTTSAEEIRSEAWNLYARWERRWTPMLLSRAAFGGSWAQSSTTTWSWSPSAYLQLGPGRHGLEVRAEVAAGRRRSAREEAFVRSSLRAEVRPGRAFLLRAEAKPEVVFPSEGDTDATLVVSFRMGADL